MKNYKFVFGLLLSSVLGSVVHASTGNAHADGPALSDPAVASAGHANAAGPDARTAQRLAKLDTIGGSLSAVRATLPVIEVPVDEFIRRVDVPRALYPSHDQRATAQGLMAETKMAVHAAVAEDVAEPASEVLLLAGLSALAIAVRRQSKS